MGRILWLASVFLLASCNYYRPTGLRGGPTQGTPIVEIGQRKATFQTITQSFLKPYCLRCHQGAEPKGGIALDNYQWLISSESIVPGLPDKSPVFEAMDSGYMPEKPPMPSKEEIAVFKTWIAEGALEK